MPPRADARRHGGPRSALAEAGLAAAEESAALRALRQRRESDRLHGELLADRARHDRAAAAAAREAADAAAAVAAAARAKAKARGAACKRSRNRNCALRRRLRMR